MGREVKRVPVDFDWPVGEVWEGYINPHYKRCLSCNGRGQTSAYTRLSNLVNLILMSGEDSIKKRQSFYFDNIVFERVIPSKDMEELTSGLAGRPLSGRLFGHDAIDRWEATAKIIKAAGLDPSTWGICQACKGSGVHPDVLEAYEAWEKQELPEGEGWQVWETVSEGSPISPVFSTADQLENWLIEQDYSEGAVEQFVKDGWAPSLAMSGGRLVRDIEAHNLERSEQ